MGGFQGAINIDPRLGKLAQLLSLYKKALAGPQQGPGGTPPFLPSGTASISPSQEPGPGPDVSGASAPVTGTMPLPTPTPMKQGISGTGPVGALMGMISQHFTKKDREEHVEAENLAKNLMQAMQNRDQQTIDAIMNSKHATTILNKVYKGWLTQMEKMNEPGEEPDPHVQGFQSGLQKTLQPQKTPQPSTPTQQDPRRVGRYLLPGASPEQQLAGLSTSANLQALKRDPGLAGPQLTSGEERLSALGKAGLAMTPAMAAEMLKYNAQVQTATANAQRAEMELRRAQQQYQLEGQRFEAQAKEADAKYLIALQNVDAARYRAEAAKARWRGTKNLTFANTAKIKAAEQAVAYLEAMAKEKRTFNKDDVSQLATLLAQSGATSLARSLPTGWWSFHMPRLLGGTATFEDTAGILAAAKAHLQVLKDVATQYAGGQDIEETPPSTDLGTTEEDLPQGTASGAPAANPNWKPQ